MSPAQLLDLLRQHYTTGPGPANQVASYLLSVVGNGRRPKEKPLTEPASTAAGAAGEQGSKRRPRPDEPAADPTAQRPPGEIRGAETAVGDPGPPPNANGRPGAISPKRRQQAERPAEPDLPSRSKKLGQPATANRVPEPEPVRPSQAIPAQPSDSLAARPVEPAVPREPAPSPEAKPAETAPRAEAAKSESSPETGQAQPAAPIEPPRAAPRPERSDQPAFSAPSP